jgi:hypothetical protein
MRLRAATAGADAAADLGARLAELRARTDEASRALPPSGQAAVKNALDVSARRIEEALAKGQVSADEAGAAAHMLAEMIDQLVAIERGEAAVHETTAYGNADLRGLEVKTTSGDVLRIGVRPLGNDSGEARIKLESVVDDGADVGKPKRMMIRFDLEGSSAGNPGDPALSVDVQFGHERFDPAREKLDLRIHGVLLDDDGNPVINRAGRAVADHHFRHGVPDSLDDPDGFAAFAARFLDELETLRPGVRPADQGDA